MPNFQPPAVNAKQRLYGLLQALFAAANVNFVEGPDPNGVSVAAQVEALVNEIIDAAVAEAKSRAA
ncbi:MAG: hypothetical protein SFU56_14920 [Capsulimonadales bacterium]|nr:hypothetical protein [Capsulimonadales bacterium]